MKSRRCWICRERQHNNEVDINVLLVQKTIFQIYITLQATISAWYDCILYLYFTAVIWRGIWPTLIKQLYRRAYSTNGKQRWEKSEIRDRWGMPTTCMNSNAIRDLGCSNDFKSQANYKHDFYRFFKPSCSLEAKTKTFVNAVCLFLTLSWCRVCVFRHSTDTFHCNDGHWLNINVKQCHNNNGSVIIVLFQALCIRYNE